MRQHDLALRGSVNLMMCRLTGNYKADQVHVRDLLERLAPERREWRLWGREGKGCLEVLEQRQATFKGL